MKKLQKLDWVCDRLSISEITARRMLAKGEIPGFKIRGSWRFDEDVIQEWIQNSMLNDKTMDSATADVVNRYKR